MTFLRFVNSLHLYRKWLGVASSIRQLHVRVLVFLIRYWKSWSLLCPFRRLHSFPIKVLGFCSGSGWVNRCSGAISATSPSWHCPFCVLDFHCLRHSSDSNLCIFALLKSEGTHRFKVAVLGVNFLLSTINCFATVLFLVVFMMWVNFAQSLSYNQESSRWNTTH